MGEYRDNQEFSILGTKSSEKGNMLLDFAFSVHRCSGSIDGLITAPLYRISPRYTYYLDVESGQSLFACYFMGRLKLFLSEI